MSFSIHCDDPLTKAGKNVLKPSGTVNETELEVQKRRQLERSTLEEQKEKERIKRNVPPSAKPKVVIRKKTAEKPKVNERTIAAHKRRNEEAEREKDREMARKNEAYSNSFLWDDSTAQSPLDFSTPSTKRSRLDQSIMDSCAVDFSRLSDFASSPMAGSKKAFVAEKTRSLELPVDMRLGTKLRL
ncbi:hypothetical protein AAVH_40545, partial [Aphelenchoides avenae]